MQLQVSSVNSEIRAPKGVLIMNYHETVRARIESRLQVVATGCYEWQGALDKDGYGYIKIDGKLPRIHRVMYELCTGPVPPGMLLRHTCDNRKCGNPAHLILGTIADNNRDRIQRNPVVVVQERHRQPGSMEERFWGMVNKDGPIPEHKPELGPCWLWTGMTDGYGYGRFKINYKNSKAHRVSYNLEFGEVPQGLCVLHSCDNPGCVNPGHLFAGTRKDNMADRDAKGRNVTGHTTGNWKPVATHLHSAIMLDRAARGDAHGTHTHPECVVRGDRHWARTNPEKRPTGERHGSKTHPEAVPRGDGCPWSKLTAEQVKAIRTEYRVGDISQDALGRKHGISQTQISRIISGIRWAQ